MSNVKIENHGNHVEYVTVLDPKGVRDTATVQAGGKVELPNGYTVLETTQGQTHIKVSGLPKPTVESDNNKE
jgi:hypothetical protein